MDKEFSSDSGTITFREIMKNKSFTSPKAVSLIKYCMYQSTKDSDFILDFFSGSGTTAHAVMRLNRQDDGRRQCISVTNNEVAANEQVSLRKQGLRPGEADWERWGICDYITKPRVEAAITGLTSVGQPIKGDYKFR